MKDDMLYWAERKAHLFRSVQAKACCFSGISKGEFGRRFMPPVSMFGLKHGSMKSTQLLCRTLHLPEDQMQLDNQTASMLALVVNCSFLFPSFEI
jgi:hypothetical protein